MDFAQFVPHHIVGVIAAQLRIEIVDLEEDNDVQHAGEEEDPFDVCIMYVVIDAKEEDQLIIQDKEEVLYGYALEANLEGCV